jgi:hypothetical protein
MQVDVKNAFNNISQAATFTELCDVVGPLANIVPFNMLFYGTHFSLFY